MTMVELEKTMIKKAKELRALDREFQKELDKKLRNLAKELQKAKTKKQKAAIEKQIEAHKLRFHWLIDKMQIII